MRVIVTKGHLDQNPYEYAAKIKSKEKYREKIFKEFKDHKFKDEDNYVVFYPLTEEGFPVSYTFYTEEEWEHRHEGAEEAAREFQEQFYTENPIRLKSVGCFYNPITEMVYPEMKNGKPDLNNGSLLSECDEEFKSSLDQNDLEAIHNY